MPPNEQTCPNCGELVMPPRVYCRLSCRVQYEHREYARQPRLFERTVTPGNGQGDLRRDE